MLFCIVFNANLFVKRMQTTLNHSYCQYASRYMLIYYACNAHTYVYRLRSHDFLLEFYCYVELIVEILQCLGGEEKQNRQVGVTSCASKNITEKVTFRDSASYFFFFLNFLHDLLTSNTQNVRAILDREREREKGRKHILVMLITQNVFQVVEFHFDFLSMKNLKFFTREMSIIGEHFFFLLFLFRF